LETVALKALGAPAANAAKPPEVGADAGGTAAGTKLGFPKAGAPKVGCANPDCPNPLFPNAELGAAVELKAEALGGAALLNAEVLAGAALLKAEVLVALPNADAVDPPLNALNGLFCESKDPKPVPGLINPAPEEGLAEEG
jgi:hypothetical protein